MHKLKNSVLVFSGNVPSRAINPPDKPRRRCGPRKGRRQKGGLPAPDTLIGKICRIVYDSKPKQTELAIKLGIKPIHMNNILRGRAMPSPDLLNRMAEIYGIEIKGNGKR